MNVEKEVEELKKEIVRLGQKDDNGLYSVTFGILVRDPQCSQIFEALVGTLRAAKKRKDVSYDSEMLMMGVHDNVVVKLLQPPEGA